MLNLSKAIQTDLVLFAKEILGLPISFHQGQVKWLTNSTKTINILRPGNKWGKSLVGAIKHIHHHATKPRLDKNLTDEEWIRLEYNTLNFGPGYEQAREILRTVRDICQGNIIIPPQFQKEYGHTNDSKLKDWFITDDKGDRDILPYISFFTGGTLYGRSYDEMGKAFKMKSLAFISGDECGDVAELWTFTNNTLLPRLSKFEHPTIDYYGTPQPEGHDYMTMIDMAEEDMKKPDWKEKGLFYTQKGSMYDNVFLPKSTIDTFDAIMDPVLKRQVIMGEYVETGDKYLGYERVSNAVDNTIELIEMGLPGRKYITIADYAGGESVWADFTVILTLDYSEEPYRVVNFQRFKGGDVPIPMQYQLTEELTLSFGGRGSLLIDSSSLGGKNAMAFMGHLQPISCEFGPTRSSTLKANMLASLKIALDGGQSETRKRKRDKVNGVWVDLNPDWGLIRYPEIPVLINELQNYKLDDTKIRQDCVMALAMGIHWLEMRRPRRQVRSAIELDFLTM